MSKLELISDKVATPITWKETFGGIFGIKSWVKIAPGIGDTYQISKEKTIAILAVSFTLAAIGIIVTIVALAILAPPLVLLPLAFVYGKLAAAMFGMPLLIALGGLALTIGGLFVGSQAADAHRVATDKSHQRYF
jgi:hypothetical protein